MHSRRLKRSSAKRPHRIRRQYPACPGAGKSRPARNKIHDLFLEHVMQQAPGYKKLIEMAGAPIMPTPAAVGVIMETIAKREGINLIGVDIGGATTDVFSVFGGLFNRTVSATSACPTAFQTCWRRRAGQHHALGAVHHRRTDAQESY